MPHLALGLGWDSKEDGLKRKGCGGRRYSCRPFLLAFIRKATPEMEDARSKVPNYATPKQMLHVSTHLMPKFRMRNCASRPLCKHVLAQCLSPPRHIAANSPQRGVRSAGWPRRPSEKASRYLGGPCTMAGLRTTADSVVLIMMSLASFTIVLRKWDRLHASLPATRTDSMRSSFNK